MRLKTYAAGLLFQLNGKEKLIDAQELELFYTPVIPTKNSMPWLKKELPGSDIKASYGLGWRILDLNNRRIIFHGGWLKGFLNIIAFIPDRKIGIVILHNSETSFALKTAINFLRKID